MDRLVAAHLDAEIRSDPAGAVAVYVEDVEHDPVGWPGGPIHGVDGVQKLYEQLTSDISTESMTPTRQYYGDDFCVVEHDWTGTVPGSLLGIPGRGRRITFRILHVFEFRGGLISRENVWMDTGAIVAQLTAP